MFACVGDTRQYPAETITDWLPRPAAAMTVFFLLFVTYFLVVSGIVYDIIIEPPSMGTEQANPHSSHI